MIKKAPHQLSQQVDAKVSRKLNAQKKTNRTIWMGLGMIGLIGWSVVVPSLLGAALGIWLDKNYASSHSWTLILLMAGLSLGCFNAWQWVEKEDKAIHQHHKESDE